MTWVRHTFEFVVQETHLDSFGHMNNAVYLEIFENARWDFIHNRGFGYKHIQQVQIGPTILEIQVKFKRELRLRQKVKVESFVAAYDGKIGELVQEMRDEKGELLTEMRMKMGLFDMKARRLIAPTPEWLKAVGLEEMQTR
jgi:thioesterase-3